MGKISVVIALAFAVCLSMTAFAEGPKNYLVDPDFPAENTSGSEIYQEVRGGADTIYYDANDSSLSFRNESLFIIRADTGMSPHVPEDKGVRTPSASALGAGTASAAGTWAFTLTDVRTSFLKLNLYQTADAVYGSGELTENGVVTSVTAGGTVLGDRLSLYVTPEGSSNLYRLSLSITQGSMDGDYVFSSMGVTQAGVAFGSQLSSTQGNAATAQTAAQSTTAAQSNPANQSA